MNKRAIAKILGIFLLAMSTSVVLADGQRGKMEKMGKGHRGMGAGNPDKMFSQLNLTEDQEKKIKTIHEGKKEKSKKFRKSMRATRKTFQEMMKDGTKTNEELKGLHEAMISAKTAMMRAKFANMLEIRDTLTPEQRKKFQFIMHEKKKGKKGKRGKRGKRGRRMNRGKGNGHGGPDGMMGGDMMDDDNDDNDDD